MKRKRESSVSSQINTSLIVRVSTQVCTEAVDMMNDRWTTSAVKSLKWLTDSLVQTKKSSFKFVENNFFKMFPRTSTLLHLTLGKILPEIKN